MSGLAVWTYRVRGLRWQRGRPRLGPAPSRRAGRTPPGLFGGPSIASAAVNASFTLSTERIVEVTEMTGGRQGGAVDRSKA
jgi:hypothetical protein